LAKVEIDGITKIWGDLSCDHVVALEDVSFTIGSNEFLCILGPSGSGKSTLLHIIRGLEKATRGKVTFCDVVDSKKPLSNLVFQEFALFPWKNVLENIAIGLKLRGIPNAKSRIIAEEYVKMMGLNGSERKYPHELSGGMKQRVAIARVLANDPEVILMDEPFASVDAQTRTTLQGELLRIWEAKRKTVAFVTHSIEEAILLGDRIVVLSKAPGRVKDIFMNDLPRPRSLEDRLSDSFRQLYQRAWELIKEESDKDEGESLSFGK